MIAKITTNSMEPPRRAKEQAKGVSAIPCELAVELDKFKKRNQIGSNKHCQRCIKAHAIKKAKEMKLDNEVLESIEEMFDCEAGHMGYYKDGEEIIQL